MTIRTSTFEIRRLSRDEHGSEEAVVLIDGRDQLADIGRDLANTWIGLYPEEVIGPESNLLARPEPHDAFVARCSCGELGCGALIARIARQGERVVWGELRDGSNANEMQRPLNNATFAFDAGQYERAVLGTSNFRSDWQPTTRHATRLAFERLHAGLPGIWRDTDLRLRFAGCQHRNDEVVMLKAMLGKKGDSDRAMLRRVMTKQSDESSEELAARIIAFYTSGAFLSDQLVERRGFT